jgi:gamma-glutamyltranspeptidase/glutathione hydrolase
MSRLLILLLVACSQPAPKQTPPPTLPPPPVVAVADAAVVVTPPPPVDAAVAVAGPKFRTEASTFNVDPKLSATGKTFMVASEDRYATQVGHDVLAAGGNAVDAAVATAFTLAVTRPNAGNLGGGGFAVVRTGKGKVSAIDFPETAPAAATPDMYKGNPKASLSGFLASGVPGSVAGLEQLHKKFGKKKWADMIAPAIKLARDGYVITPDLEAIIVRANTMAPMAGALASIYAPNGKPVAVGDTVKNPELAVVLERIAAKGSAGFYKGETAKAIAKTMHDNGGIVTEKDLAGYKALWRKPIKVQYRGKQLYTMPPPSSGGIVIAMTANMLRGLDLAKLGWHSTAHIHYLTEVWRRAFAARNEVLGDPAYVKNIPVAKLTSQAEADRLFATISDGATPSKDVPALIEGKHTTDLSVVDGKGMAVALTTTLNTSWGSGVMISGVIMNNEMDDFATQPGKPNVFGLVQGAANKIEPGKRMLSSMSPTIIEDDKGELYMVVGAEGGPRIITAVWQTLSNVIDFAMPVDAAIAAQRMHHQHLPDDIAFDDEAVTREVDAELGKLGYVRTWKRERVFAAANAIVRTQSGWAGASDPRTGGGAMGDE